MDTDITKPHATPDPRRLSWSPAIEVGIPDIDAQHQRLFELAATFAGNGDQIRVMRTLNELCDYANVHLRDEEALLASIAYPGLAEHQKHHARFREMLRELLIDARGMSLDDIAGRIEELIYGWFQHHILTVDAEYVPAVLAHAGESATT